MLVKVTRVGLNVVKAVNRLLKIPSQLACQSGNTYLIFAVHVHFTAIENLSQQHLIASQCCQVQLNV